MIPSAKDGGFLGHYKGTAPRLRLERPQSYPPASAPRCLGRAGASDDRVPTSGHWIGHHLGTLVVGEPRTPSANWDLGRARASAPRCLGCAGCCRFHRQLRPLVVREHRHLGDFAVLEPRTPSATWAPGAAGAPGTIGSRHIFISLPCQC